MSLALIACREEQAASKPAPTSAPTPTQAPLLSAAPVARSLPDGCFEAVPPLSEPEAALRALGDACLRGFAPASQARLTDRKSSTLTATLEVTAPTCLRAVAVAGGGVHPLRVQLANAGTTLSDVELPATFALAPLDGPQCVATPGQYRATAHLPRRLDGDAGLRVSLWRTAMDADRTAAAPEQSEQR